MKLKLIISTVLCILFQPAFSKTNMVKNSSDSITVEGIFNPSKLKNYPDFESEVMVYASQYPSDFSDLTKFKDHLLFRVKTKLGGYFKIQIPCKAQFMYLHISYFLPIESAIPDPFYDYNNIFIASKGDKLDCLLKTDKIEFKADTRKMYECQSEIFQVHDKFEPAVDQFNKGNYFKYTSMTDSIMTETLKSRITILKKYQKNFNQQIYDILLLNCYSYKKRMMHGTYYGLAIQFPNFRRYLQSKQLSFDLGTDTKKFTDYTKTKAQYYSTSIMIGIKLKLYLMSSDSIPKKPRFEDVFNEILFSQKGKLRDMLIVSSFMQLLDNTSKPAVSFIDKAISEVTTPIYKDVLLDIKKYKAKGSNLLDYSFKNEKDEFVNLSTFGGKVIILDFWYTGCENCIILTEKMEPILEIYKSNPNVVFVSVSIDKDKKRWLESLKSNKYTSTQSINLYTGGVAANHDFIRNYNITGYPTVYLVKNNKIVSSNPPLPLRPEGSVALIKLIDSSIQDNNGRSQ